MGYRCSVDYVDVSVIKGKEAYFRDWLKDEALPRYIKKYNDAENRANNQNSMRDWAKLNWLETKKEVLAELDAGAFEFAFWQDNKIVGYWYPLFSMFCRDLAMFLEGSVTLIGEDSEQMARITWEDGECLVETAEMVWSGQNDIQEVSSGRMVPLTNGERLIRQL